MCFTLDRTLRISKLRCLHSTQPPHSLSQTSLLSGLQKALAWAGLDFKVFILFYIIGLFIYCSFLFIICLFSYLFMNVICRICFYLLWCVCLLWFRFWAVLCHWFESVTSEVFDAGARVDGAEGKRHSKRRSFGFFIGFSGVYFIILLVIVREHV